MKICTTLALLLALILLLGCGGATGPRGKWKLDPREMKVRWDRLYQDLIDNEEEEEEDEEYTAGNPTNPFNSDQNDKNVDLLKNYTAMGLCLEIDSDGTFIHRCTKNGNEGKGTWTQDDEIVILKPASGANFIQGMNSVKFQYSGHLLTEHLVLRPDGKNARPLLLFRRGR